MMAVAELPTMHHMRDRFARLSSRKSRSKPKSPKIDVFGCPASKLHKDQELRGAGIKFFRKGQ